MDILISLMHTDIGNCSSLHNSLQLGCSNRHRKWSKGLVYSPQVVLFLHALPKEKVLTLCFEQAWSVLMCKIYHVAVLRRG